MSDIYHIVRDCGTNQAHSRGKSWDRASEARALIERNLQLHTATAPLVMFELVYWFSKTPDRTSWSLTHQETKEVEKVLAEHLRKQFVQGDCSFEPVIEASSFALWPFNRALSCHPEYDSFRSQHTQKLIHEAGEEEGATVKGGIVLSLVNAQHPVTDGPVRPDQYEFSVDMDTNTRFYDMKMLLPYLREWYGEGLEDELASLAFKSVAKAYEL